METKVAAQDIFAGVEHECLHGACDDMRFTGIEFSSREVAAGSLFFCVKGTQVDGHTFAPDAVSRGATALVVSHELPELDVPQYVVGDTRAALAACSCNFYGNPSHALQLVGITGTNGKTTTTFLVEHIAQVAGKKAGLMGTVECHIGQRVVPSLHTTPESRDLQRMLAEMVDAGVEVAALEVSSHAIDLGRIEGTRFAVAAFSNLTQDHLDYHKTMENYFAAKAKLFTEHEVGCAVVCTDGSYGQDLAMQCVQRGVGGLITVGSGANARLRVVSAEYSAHSTEVTVRWRHEDLRFTLGLVGRFNVENALLAFGIGLALGFEPRTIIEALETAPQVPGRLERVGRSDGSFADFSVLVDYAHTPDAVEKAIAAVRAVTEGRVICVFGCGGDRDAIKRPKMGTAALTADFAVVTSDNPRTEDPHAIIQDILPGMEGHEDRYTVVEDRRSAIAHALSIARPGDCVLVAGKGHEDYQIIGTTKHHFDDREVAREELDAL